MFSNPMRLGKIVNELEIDASHAQSRMNIGVRLGPAMGLIGTLIPMGPALTGLSSGNMEIIAGNLSVAFSTTIVGLAVSAICYFISVSRRHWYARDISDIEYVYQCLFLDQQASIEEEYVQPARKKLRTVQNDT